MKKDLDGGTDAVKIEYDHRRLSAIYQAMDKRGEAPEKYLLETMDRLYVRFVPPTVREFLDYEKAMESGGKSDAGGMGKAANRAG